MAAATGALSRKKTLSARNLEPVYYSMICTRGCNCSFMCLCWWARWTPETCRV